MSTQSKNVNGGITLGVKQPQGLLLYAVDISQALDISKLNLDDAGVPYQKNPTGYHPSTIAQFALHQWNRYVADKAEEQLTAFLVQARWLVEHEVPLGAGAGGWPISLPHPDVPGTGSWLSALAQGSALSVLVRAYQITQEKEFLDIAQRAACTFERDILDGGVSAPIGKDGIFFEEVAVYPANHKLSGCLLALLGLYDYLAFSHDTRIEEVLERCLTTVHALLDEFDDGLHLRADFLRRRSVDLEELSLLAELLEAIAASSNCEHCLQLAALWRSHHCHFATRLRHRIASRFAMLRKALAARARKKLFPRSRSTGLLRTCVPIHAFPVTGGMRAVLSGMSLVTSGLWQIEYVTQRADPEREGYSIHAFGTYSMSPWQFPMVWLYFLAGLRKLIALMHQGADYQLILPQDGVFTAAFAGMAGKLTGKRVVCIDHGNLTLVDSSAYRTERLQALATKHRLRRMLDPILFVGYWPSLAMLARIAARSVDHFLIPGVEGDGVEEACRRLGVYPCRITRFASMVDTDRYVVPDPLTKATMRKQKDIATDAIVLSIVCRLAPEKGLGVAIDSLSQALATLPAEARERVQIIIAGDGPLRKQLEGEMHRRRLDQNCQFWGEVSSAEVISLLGLTDIFLYTSIRGACFSMAILEAMAAGCAVVASTLPISNRTLLAEGRGIAVPAGDAKQTALAIGRLLNNPELCRQMGSLARDYIAAKHNAHAFKRVLMRVTYWASLDELIRSSNES